MIPVSIVVTHVPEVHSRRVMLRRQQAAMGGVKAIKERVASYRVINDQLVGDVPRKRTMARVLRKAWRAYDASATHVLILADDMLPAEGFMDALADVIETVPDAPVGLFSMRQCQREVFDRGERWYTGATGLWGGAILLPVPMLQDIDAWCERCVPAEYKHDDGRIQMYTLTHGITCWFTTPSLLEHIGASESLLGQNNRTRVAGLYLPDVSALSFREVPEKPYHNSQNGYKEEIAQWVRCPDDGDVS